MSIDLDIIAQLKKRIGRKLGCFGKSTSFHSRNNCKTRLPKNVRLEQIT